jgi:hypothetical protein
MGELVKDKGIEWAVRLVVDGLCRKIRGSATKWNMRVVPWGSVTGCVRLCMAL